MSNKSSWRFRKATSTDTDVVLAMPRAAHLPPEGVLDHFPDGYIVAESGGGVIAVAGLEAYGAFGLLRSMAVYLLATTAQAYFAGCGFARVGREDVPAGIRASVEFASACPGSAVCMFRTFT